MFSKYLCSNHCFELSSIHFQICSLKHVSHYNTHTSMLMCLTFWVLVVHKVLLFLAVCRGCSAWCVSNSKEGGWSISWKCTFAKAAVKSSLWVCQQSCQNKNNNRYIIYWNYPVCICNVPHAVTNMLPQQHQLCKYNGATFSFREIKTFKMKNNQKYNFKIHVYFYSYLRLVLPLGPW